MLFLYKNVFLSEFLEYLLIKPTALQEPHNKAVECFFTPQRYDNISNQQNNFRVFSTKKLDLLLIIYSHVVISFT